MNIRAGRMRGVLMLAVASLLAMGGTARAQADFNIMFYNVENLFDTRHDTLKDDCEFLPGATRNWTYTRYQAKLVSIARVIAGISGFNLPAIVGLCEVENDSCLIALTRRHLRQAGYRFIHHESPDRRGIDCALLYREERFRPLSDSLLRVTLPADSTFRTRDILYVRGLADGADTLHLFVCHLPSRRGGQHASAYKRIHAAGVMLACADSIMAKNPEARIVIMGDMNDGPADESMAQLNRHGMLVNLMLPLLSQDMGTHKYRGEWSLFDQFIVSRGLQRSPGGIRLRAEQRLIWSPPHLTEPDDAYLGLRPRRTYQGLRYTGGYSDHLPILLRLTTSAAGQPHADSRH